MTRKILYVVNFEDFFLSHRKNLALAARRAGYDVHVAVPNGPRSDEIRALGFTLHDYPLSRKGMNPWQECVSLRVLRGLYRIVKPDLLHHLTIKPMLYGSLAARVLKNVAIVNAVTGMGHVFTAEGLRAGLIRNAIVFAYRQAFRARKMKVIFQNPDDRDYFLKAGIIDAGRAVVIKGSGVDPRQFSPRPEPDGSPLAVLASRLLWSKGVGDFVDAAKLLKRRGLAARFALVGSTDPGNPAGVPEDTLKQWSEEGAVEWWGRRNDMPEVLAQASVVCLPSYYREGVPRVLIEAAAAGRPIVTTDEPGCREIVKDGLNGFLVPSRNAAVLAEALEKLLTDPSLRLRMGKAGRDLAVREFSEESVIERTLAVYEDLLRSN